MDTPINFSKYAMNQLKIDNLTQAHLVGPVYELLKGTCTSSIELEYNMEECFKALTDKLNWNNPEGDRFPFNLTKPRPLKDPKKKYTTSIMKTKVARYKIVGIKKIVPTLWSATKVGYNKDAKKGIKHCGEKRQLNVYSTQKILSVVSVSVKKLHGYDHLEEIAVRRADREKTFPGIEFKELHTPSYKPPRVIYEDLKKQKRVMWADELYKFSDGTLKTVRDDLHHRILNFRLGYNKEMSRRKWTDIDKRRSELMVELIDKQMRERPIIRNLERLVGARELEMDYRLMTRTE
ncbi:hypothetical protein Tco_1069174 [Tanacetum coccineum]|uniref:Uncharacterized protein n=1 Tax=Tanacetum coccineum TaxID=301880 RepID=A0ABQ5HJP1_9ASTR